MDAETFKKHIEMKDQQTKKERADFLYNPNRYTFDCALPQNWIYSTMEKTGANYDEISSGFVWGYLREYNGPLPLNLNACAILEKLEELEK
jgi:hypothetical protein